MIEFGKTLRAAREAKGLTTGQIAERTHMMAQTVEGLENENFSKIVAPIYGRGFVKLYCETVGLDPKPMVDAFMELYSDHREASAAEPVAPSSHIAPKPPLKPEELNFELSEPSSPTTAPATAPEPKQPSLSRYAASIPQESEPNFSLPCVNWRLVALVAGAFVVLLCVALGIRAIYRATMTAPEPPPVEETTPEPPTTNYEPEATNHQPPPPTTATTTRKPLPLKPFYIDSDHSTELERKN